MTTVKLCEHCGEREVCHNGARFCGAACTARHEAGEPKGETMQKLEGNAVIADDQCECGATRAEWIEWSESQ